MGVPSKYQIITICRLPKNARWIHGHFRNPLDWRYLPYFLGLCKGIYPQNMAVYTILGGWFMISVRMENPNIKWMIARGTVIRFKSNIWVFHILKMDLNPPVEVSVFFFFFCGGSVKLGYPNRWIVYFMENPNIKWMINGVPPWIRKPPMIYGSHLIDIILNGSLTYWNKWFTSPSFAVYVWLMYGWLKWLMWIKIDESFFSSVWWLISRDVT